MIFGLLLSYPISTHFFPHSLLFNPSEVTVVPQTPETYFCHGAFAFAVFSVWNALSQISTGLTYSLTSKYVLKYSHIEVFRAQSILKILYPAPLHLCHPPYSLSHFYAPFSSKALLICKKLNLLCSYYVSILWTFSK